MLLVNNLPVVLKKKSAKMGCGMRLVKMFMFGANCIFAVSMFIRIISQLLSKLLLLNLLNYLHY